MDRKQRPAHDRPWSASGIDETARHALAAGLAPSAVWSLLMEVFAQRAAARAPAEILQQWERDGFTRLSPVDQRTLLELDRVLLAAAEAFEAVELSPLAPLAACSVVGLGSQNRVVSALRGTEVVADPTNVLALECARRLRARSGEVVRLATSHRCVRAQPLPKGSGFARHFRIFCLATAGRERKDHDFVITALQEQIRAWLRALARLEREERYAFSGRRLTVLAAPGRERLADAVAGGIDELPVSRGVLEHRYYSGLRFTISLPGVANGIPLVDGGAFDWLAKLTSNRRLAFVASGMGSQLAAALFRKP